jgi:uncharacterized protein DUF1877
MVARGVHYALTNDQYEGLRAQPDDFSRIEYLTIEIGEPAVEAFLQDTDKAWDAIHRCLGDFPPDTPWFYPVDPEYGAYALPEDFGSYPLKLCILGGRKLMDDESLYFMRLIESHEVADVAEALKSVTEHWFAQKYWAQCKGAWPEYGEEDLGYAWSWFEPLRDFFIRMAPTGRPIVFTADQ